MTITLGADISVNAQPDRWVESSYSGEEYFDGHWARSVLVDDNGLVWIGTTGGLYTFNGKESNRIELRGPTQHIKSVSIQNIEQTPDGTIWVASLRSGLFRLNPATNETQVIVHGLGKNEIPGSEIVDLYCENDSSIWIGTFKTGMARLNVHDMSVDKWSLGRIGSSATGEGILAIESHSEDPNLLWLGGWDALWLFDKSKETFTPSRILPSEAQNSLVNGVSDILVDEDIIWVGNWGGGLRSYNNSTGVWTSFLHDTIQDQSFTSNIVRDIIRFSDDEIALATTDLDAIVFDKQSATFRKTVETNFKGKTDPEKQGSFDVSLYQDLLFTAGNFGLRVLSEKPKALREIQYLDAENAPSWIHIIHQIEEGWLLMNYDGNALFEIDNDGALKSAHYYEKQHFDNINFIAKRHVGGYWLGSNKGLFVLNKTLDEIQSYEDIYGQTDPCLGNGVSDISAVNDRLWITTGTNEILTLDQNGSTNSIKVFGANNLSLSLRRVELIEDDLVAIGTTFGVVFVNFSGQLVYHLRHDSKFANSIPSHQIADIVYHADSLWILTETGNVLFQPRSSFGSQKVVPFTGPKASSRVKVQSMMVSEGKIWFETPSFLMAHNLESKETQIWSGIHGLDYPSNWGHAVETNKNRVLIGTRSGLELFDLNELEHDAFFPPVKINSLVVNHRVDSLQPSGNIASRTITLSYPEDGFSIDFSAQEFLFPNQIEYAYQLEGSEWIELGSKGSFIIANLEGGDYEVKVKSTNPLGIWNDEHTSIHLEVIPPFWENTLLRIAFVLIVLSLIIAFVIIRTRQVLKREKLKNEHQRKLATLELKALRLMVNPHFMFNSLNSINSFLLNNESREASNYLGQFASLMRKTLNYSQQQLISLEDEIEVLKIYTELEALRFGNKFDFQIDLTDEIDQMSTYIPPLITQPFVENAIWHGLSAKQEGMKGIVSLKIFTEGEEVCFEIRDNGVGRKKLDGNDSKSRKSYGVKFSQERIQMTSNLHGTEGDFQIVDLQDPLGKPEGTLITFRLPLIHESTHDDQGSNSRR